MFPRDVLLRGTSLISYQLSAVAAYLIAHLVEVGDGEVTGGIVHSVGRMNECFVIHCSGYHQSLERRGVST